VSVRTILILLLALVFGISAALGINTLMGGKSSGPGGETVPVVVAADEVPRFTTLTTDLLKTVNVSKELVPDGSISRVEDAVGRVVTSSLLKGETLLEGKLTPKGTGGGLAGAIPDGLRAVAIQTPNVATGVAGFIQPGNKVDVLFTTRQSGQNDPTGGGSTTVLLQNVEILAVDQKVEAPAGNKIDPREMRSVTLLVTEKEASNLTLAQNTGTLQLSLRNPQDKKPVSPHIATVAGLRGNQGKAWEDRVKLLVALGQKFMESRKQTQQPAKATPASAEESEPPPLPPIRTLRGAQRGWVPLE
jgi:pilus assembly protein CpaB